MGVNMLAGSKRLNDQLESYWLRLKGDKALPEEIDIDPDKLNGSWEDCFLVACDHEDRFQYSYLGKKLFEAFGVAEDSPADIETLLSTNRPATIDKFEQVIADKTIVVDEGEFTNSNNMVIKYRQILLPFSNDGEQVTHVFGGMRWKVA